MSVSVKYIGSSKEQVNWGSNDDPAPLLVEGQSYVLDHEEVHTWHTKYHLRDFPGKKFNSTSFEPSRIGEGWDGYTHE